MKNSRYPKGISANILLLGIVSFLNDLSSEMIMPILPMFITTLGGSGLVVGLIGGLRDSIASILKVLCGYWSDKIGKRKPFVYSGYLTSSIFKLLLTFSKTWQHILIFASLERIGIGFLFANSLIAFVILFAFYGMVYAIVDGNQRAFVSDLSSGELRATALGSFHTTIGLAALPASLIAGFLWQINPSITFIYGAGVSIISVALFLICLK